MNSGDQLTPGNDTAKLRPGVSIIIKALNEEKHIESAIRSALECIPLIGGEIIVADSGSTDCTIEIARQFPVTIVQLADPREASCGIGPQLGYQEAQGEFIYILDGDMELMPAFLEAAFEQFDRDPSLAGIGGMLDQSGKMNAEFRLRRNMVSEVRLTGPVSHLGGGGVYRTAAVRSVRYISNRNFHSFEELELGVRLLHAGWKLVRLPIVSIHHYPHQQSGYVQLWDRMKTRRFFGPGEVLRASMGKPYFLKIFRKFRFVYVTAAWLLTIFMGALLSPDRHTRILITFSVFLFPFVAMSLKYRDAGSGVYGLFSWILSLGGSICGFMTPQKDPTGPIARNVIRRGEWVPPAP
jgi:glycosyltransferase involved in cell wall biosynthesis